MFICYGPKCDDILFNNYGFVFKAGENDDNSIKLFPDEIMEELVEQEKAPRSVIDERYANLLRKIENESDFLLCFDLMKLRRNNVDWNLWYFPVCITGGSVEGATQKLIDKNLFKF